jgi:hypothetical protein
MPLFRKKICANVLRGNLKYSLKFHVWLEVLNFSMILSRSALLCAVVFSDWVAVSNFNRLFFNTTFYHIIYRL